MWCLLVFNIGLFMLKIFVKKKPVHTQKVLKEENEHSISQKNISIYTKMSQRSQCIHFLPENGSH